MELFKLIEEILSLAGAIASIAGFLIGLATGWGARGRFIHEQEQEQESGNGMKQRQKQSFK